MILYWAQILLQSLSTVIAIREWWRFRSAFWACIGSASALMVARRITALMVDSGLHAEFLDRVALPLSISILVFAASAMGSIMERERGALQLEVDDEFQYSTVGRAHVALDGRVVKINDKLCELWGLSRDFVLSESFTWQSITPEPDLSEDLRRLGQLLQSVTNSYSLDKRYRRGDGSTIWAHLTVWRVHDRSGKLKHLSISVVGVGFARKLTQSIDKLQNTIERLS